jgi:hypothetical protein
MWRIGRVPNSIPIYSYIQQDATSHRLFISGNCSRCYGWYFQPPTLSAHFYPHPYVPHALPISFISTVKVLQVIKYRMLQHILSYHWPCSSNVQRTAKKQNMTTVHILTSHSVLFSPFNFFTQQTPKIFQHDTSHCSSQCVSQQIIIIILVISYRSIFFSILLSQYNGCDEMLEHKYLTSRSLFFEHV